MPVDVSWFGPICSRWHRPSVFLNTCVRNRTDAERHTSYIGLLGRSVPLLNPTADRPWPRGNPIPGPFLDTPNCITPYVSHGLRGMRPSVHLAFIGGRAGTVRFAAPSRSHLGQGSRKRGGTIASAVSLTGPVPRAPAPPSPAPSLVPVCPVCCWRAPAFSAGGDGVPVN
jgi:hypothetical protein